MEENQNKIKEEKQEESYTLEEIKKKRIILISMIIIIFIILLVVLYGYLQYLDNKKQELLEKELKGEGEVASTEEDTANKYIAEDDESYDSNNVTIYTSSGEAVYQVISGDIYTGKE